MIEENKGFWKDKKIFFTGMIFGIVTIIVLNSVINFYSGMFFRAASKEISIPKKMNEIYHILDEHYVDEYDKKQMTEGMYVGMLYGVGDPYTSYMDKNTLNKFLEQTEGSYAGLGIVITIDAKTNRMKVTTAYEGAPAKKAGLTAGDYILKVNKNPVSGDNYEEAVSMMKGAPNTTVNLTIFRESEEKIFDVDVMREKILIPTVSHKVLNGNIGYIHISNFERVTYDQFKLAYDELNKKNVKGMIIDVRNNPGGLLDIVVQIADVLVPEGYIVYTETKDGKKDYKYAKPDKIEIPLAVLINGNSASASEVLAGAVKDTGVGELVGTQSYGKGLVQNLYGISDGSAVKVTIAKYYTPSGVCINGVGLTPDHIVDMSDALGDRFTELTIDEDVQLLEAIKVVEEKVK